MRDVIRVLRAEGAELLKFGQGDHADAITSQGKGDMGSATVEFTAALILTRMGQAKLNVADQLEAELPALPLKDEPPINYDPRGGKHQR